MDRFSGSRVHPTARLARANAERSEVAQSNRFALCQRCNNKAEKGVYRAADGLLGLGRRRRDSSNQGALGHKAECNPRSSSFGLTVPVWPEPFRPTTLRENGLQE